MPLKLPSHPCNYSVKINNSYIAYNYKIVLVRKEPRNTLVKTFLCTLKCDQFHCKAIKHNG